MNDDCHLQETAGGHAIYARHSFVTQFAKKVYLYVIDDFVINTGTIEVNMMNNHLIVLVAVELDGVTDPGICPRAIRHNVSNEWIPPPFEDLC